MELKQYLRLVCSTTILLFHSLPPKCWAYLRVEVFAGVLLAVAVDGGGEDAVHVRRAALCLTVDARRRRDRRHSAVVAASAAAVHVHQAAAVAVDHEAGVDGVLDGELLGRRDGASRLDDRRRRVRRRLATVAAARDARAAGRPLRATQQVRAR